MDQKLMNQYLHEVERELKGFSTAEKKEIVTDLKNQIQEKQSASNLPLSIILDGMGSPRELAGTYRMGDNDITKSYAPQNIMESYVYYGSSAIFPPRKKK